MNIAFLGNYSVKKGSILFKDVVKRLGIKHSWYILGEIGDIQSYSEIQAYLTKQTTYTRKQLPEFCTYNKIDLILLLSIWPETFSKTFFEALSLHIPFIATDKGFPFSFFRHYPYFVHGNIDKDIIDAILFYIDSFNQKKLIDTSIFIQQFFEKKEKELLLSEERKRDIIASFI